ncbi:Ribonuclease Z, mitochondrial [Mycena sanguinolenta]|uniref:ribonuclease Z n=1 Tax=Mycena sanguinolenta TaxID=230812 RepID=A0A8H6Z1P2_9AGAR|nr:Ribonuclease Z, mitochondrial [Mycena sanguinolenta]
MISDKTRAFENLNVIGPYGISHYLASMRFHLSRDSVHANVKDTKMVPNLANDPTPCYQDENITVYSIPISPADTDITGGETENSAPIADTTRRDQVIRLRRIGVMFPDTGELDKQDHPLHRKPPHKQDPHFHEQLPRLYEERPQLDKLPTVAYVAIFARSATLKCDVEKNDVLRVPPEEHETDDNATQTADDSTTALAQPELPLVVMILDIPSTAHINGLLKYFSRSPFFRQFRSQRPKYAVHSIFHLCGKGVLKSKGYKNFMNKFPDSNHIISSPQYDRDLPRFQSVDQLTRNRLDPVVFPAPMLLPEPPKQWHDIRDLPANCFPLEAGLELRIQHGFRPTMPSTSTEEFDLSNSTLTKFQALRAEVKKAEWGERRILLRRTKEGEFANKYDRLQSEYDVEIITLGTSGTGPAPSTLIRIPKTGSILLDCGEGTWGQLVRHFGALGANDVLRDLRCIFISGSWNDLHGGLATLLSKRQQLKPPASDPLYLMADYHIHLYLREVSDIEDLGIVNEPSKSGVISVRNEVLYSSVSSQGFEHEYNGWADPVRSYKARQEACRVLGLKSFATLEAEDPKVRSGEVHHRSYGVVFHHNYGWSIMYAGNDVSHKTLLRAGNGVTVLIHEGFSDDDKHLALVHTAHRMKAQHLLFTRLPAGRPYPRQSLQERQLRTPWPIISYAFDHARVSIGTLWKLNQYLPILQQVHREQQQELAKAGRGAEAKARTGCYATKECALQGGVRKEN